MSDDERREGGYRSGPRPYRSGGRGRSENGREGYSGPRGRRPFGPSRKVCAFCVEKGKAIDYKNADMLRRYVTERGKIVPSRASGTCARHQRKVAQAVKRARFVALLRSAFAPGAGQLQYRQFDAAQALMHFDFAPEMFGLRAEGLRIA